MNYVLFCPVRISEDFPDVHRGVERHKMLKQIKESLSSFGNRVKSYSIEQGIKLAGVIVKNTSAKSQARLLYLLESLAPTKYLKQMIKNIRVDFEKKGTWFTQLNNFFRYIHPNCKAKLIQNFVIKQAFEGQKIREDYFKKHHYQPPWLLVISPIMRCNLRCTGCYAGSYSREDDLPRKLFDKAIEGAKKLGVRFIIISGGEPFFREDILDVWKKHNDCYFMVYTNGTLIDKKMVKKLQELGNVTPAISVEGFEEATDQRRGKGVWKKVNQAMDNLKDAGVPFGFSVTPTKLNTDIITQDKFIDWVIKKGATYGWFFQYMPIGKNPDVNLMSTPQQRKKLRLVIQKKWRDTKPIFIADFWNDGPFVDGCMSGGSTYLHINVHGDVEPCVFNHFAVDNIKNKTIEEALNSPMFKWLRNRVQNVRAKDPASHNLLTPCMLIDNPEVLRECVKKFKPKFTHEGADSIVNDPKIRKFIDKYSKDYHKIADRDWKAEFGEKFWKMKTGQAKCDSCQKKACK